MKKQFRLLLITLCFGTLQAQVGPPPAPCGAPANVAITATQNTVSASWSDVPDVTTWEVFVQPIGSPAPTFTSAGVVVTAGAYSMDGLVCGQGYDFYIRAGNCGGPALLGGPHAFSTRSCFEGAGIPEHLTQCAANGEACFDIQQNDAAILGTLDPTQFTVSYYSEYANAVAENAALDSPVCFPGTQHYIYARLEKNATGESDISVFQVVSGGTNCPGLALNAFFDANGNGAQDIGEFTASSSFYQLGHFEYEINNDGNPQSVFVLNGQYSIFDADNTNSYALHFVLNPEYAAHYNVPSYTDVHTTESGLTTYHFPISAANPFHDAAISLHSVGSPRPGFTYRVYINYSNNGNVSASSGTIAFTKDAAVSVTSVSQPVTFNENGFTFDFTDLNPFQSRSVLIEMLVPVIPTVSLGQLVTNFASITVPTDAVPENNTASVAREISGSYDPNDKMEAHGKEILITSFTANDYLYYTIRFENTGTASASSIKVIDALDAQLDETSVRMINSSLNGTLSRSGNTLTWIFADIDLPPTAIDPGRSQGFINFKIKPKPDYAVGDVIPNAASIYFDFNPAIVTEPFETHFVDVLSTSQFGKINAVIYPNPANEKMIVTLDTGNIMRIVISDISGKKVLTKEAGNMPTQAVDISKLSGGMYFVEIINDSNHKTVQKLIVK